MPADAQPSLDGIGQHDAGRRDGMIRLPVDTVVLTTLRLVERAARARRPAP